ncbi:MAG TPA: alanine racemase [Trebonia sp.]|jgi:D-serine deaminase-like pyridoxal phosphate-dependent protein
MTLATLADRLIPAALAEDAELPLDTSDPQLDTPAVLIDLDAVEANITRFAQLSARNGLTLRPHAKTHKSVAMARRQLAAGAVGIAVSSVTEALAFVAGGVSDILIAYPLVGRRKLDRVVSLLTGGAAVTLVSDSAAVTEGYHEIAAAAARPLPVLVEVDTGMHRVGAEPHDVIDLAVQLARDPLLSFGGILTHAGDSHDAPDEPGIQEVARREALIMGSVRADLEKHGLEVPVVSAGSTITAPYLSATDGITELRPGTYIYNDLRTLQCHACTPDAIAPRALATVISVNGARVTIDAGSKTLTTSTIPGYGQGRLRNRPRGTFTRLSEEHGVLGLADDGPVPGVGDRVEVLPVHACVWMDLQPEVYGVRGNQVVERIAVDAMRHSL